MPSTSLFSCRLRQLATDNTFFYFMVAIVQVVWWFIYWIGIAAFSRPESCSPGTKSGAQHWYTTFICLAFFFAQAAITVAATVLTLKGTPLEPASKRRWVDVLSYAYLASLPLNVGLLAWACWVVRVSDGSCWSSGDRAMPTSIFFGGIGVLFGQAVGLAVSYNQLSDVRHGNSWHAVTRTGVSSLLHLCGGFRAQHRGPWTNLEEIVTQLQQLMRGLDADKTDVVAGLACAALLQDEAAAAAAGSASSPPAADAAVVVVPVVAGTELKDGQGGKAARLAETSDGSQQPHPQLLAWAEGICRSAAAALPDASVAGAVSARSSADEASADEAGEALRWARYAAAAYGARQHLWRRGKQGQWAARRQLAALTAAVAAEGAQPLGGWEPTLSSKPGSSQPSREQRQGFAAARELLGPSAQIVSYSAGHEPSGLLPHLLVVDSERRAVVLGIAGAWQHPHAVPAVQTQLPGWLAGGGELAAEAGATAAAAAEAGLAHRGKHAASCNGKGSSTASGTASTWVHQDSLEAAEALLGELSRHRLLHRLLQPGISGSTQAGTASGGGSPGARAMGVADSPLAGLDCTGWRLVVSGHGLGAGAAALLTLKLQAWQLGALAVLAHGPPAQLCSPDLAARLAAACSLTTVVVGDDASPLASSAAIGRLVEQSAVGLARLRYSKSGLLAALIAEKVGPKRWAGRWYNHRRALRPLGVAPAEALERLQRFRDWQKQQQQQQQGDAAPAQKPGSLPGRVLWLSRRQQQGQQGQPGVAASAAAEESSSSSSGCSSSVKVGDSSQEGWQAAWVSGEEVAAWDIRVSRCVLADHYVSRLLGVLGDLAAGGDLAGGRPEAAATAV